MIEIKQFQLQLNFIEIIDQFIFGEITESR